MKRLLAIVALLFISFATVPSITVLAQSELIITSRPASYTHATRRTMAVDTVVVHNSYNPLGGDPYSVALVTAIYNKEGVSTHYLIDREGRIYQHVPEEYVSYHAGRSKMPDGRTRVNGFSIGIELINAPTDVMTDAQYASMDRLLQSVRERHSIRYVVGHCTIAPSRKSDPWNFDWKRINLEIATCE